MDLSVGRKVWCWGQPQWLVFSDCRKTSVLRVSRLWTLDKMPKESNSGLEEP